MSDSDKSDSDCELVRVFSTPPGPPEHEAAPYDIEYQMKVRQKSGKKVGLIYNLKEAVKLPYSSIISGMNSSVLLKIEHNIDSCSGWNFTFSKSLEPWVEGWNGKHDGKYWVFEPENMDADGTGYVNKHKSARAQTQGKQNKSETSGEQRSGASGEQNRSGASREQNRSGSSGEQNRSGASGEQNRSGASGEQNRSGASGEQNKRGDMSKSSSGGDVPPAMDDPSEFHETVNVLDVTFDADSEIYDPELEKVIMKVNSTG